MSRIKRLVPEDYDHEPPDIEHEAEESYRMHGPTRAPYRGRSLENIVKSLRWTAVQQRIWRKKHGF